MKEKIVVGKIWYDRLIAKGYTIESFIKEFSSDDYRMTREELIEDLEFYIDEMLGYNSADIL